MESFGQGEVPPSKLIICLYIAKLTLRSIEITLCRVSTGSTVRVNAKCPSLDPLTRRRGGLGLLVSPSASLHAEDTASTSNSIFDGDPNIILESDCLQSCSRERATLCRACSNCAPPYPSVQILQLNIIDWNPFLVAKVSNRPDSVINRVQTR